MLRLLGRKITIVGTKDTTMKKTPYNDKIPYSDKLDADQQISTEKEIASYLLKCDGSEDEDNEYPDLRPDDSTCLDNRVSPWDDDLNQAARDILYIVLRES